MAHRVLIPTPLRPYTGNQEAVEVEGNTVGQVLDALTAQHNGLRRHLYSDDGKLRSFVNVYVNDEDIRYLDRDATQLQPSDVISIVPSVAGGAPVVTEPAAPDLTQAEYERYSRHLVLPEVGLDGQRRLKAARVLCVGAGGLGSTAALYLAAAGVGTIGVVDFDVVDASNLQQEHGFAGAKSLTGGILTWIDHIERRSRSTDAGRARRDHLRGVDRQRRNRVRLLVDRGAAGAAVPDEAGVRHPHPAGREDA